MELLEVLIGCVRRVEERGTVAALLHASAGALGASGCGGGAETKIDKNDDGGFLDCHKSVDACSVHDHEVLWDHRETPRYPNRILI